VRNFKGIACPLSAGRGRAEKELDQRGASPEKYAPWPSDDAALQTTPPEFIIRNS
jgi:hypothetical protein